MRRFCVVLFVCLCSLAMYGQKTRFGQAPRVKAGVDYPIRLHISGIHIRTYYVSPSWIGPNQDAVYADAVVDGKKIELMGAWTWIDNYQTPLSPGDFPARLVKNAPKMSVSPINQQYELALPGGVAWHCVVTGVSE